MPRKSLKNNDKIKASKVEDKVPDDSNNGQAIIKENSLSNSELKIDNEEKKIEFKIDDIVWAKMRDFPFWPARITEIIFKKPLKESTPNPRRGRKSSTSSNEANEFMVNFFGDNSNRSVNKKNLKHYDCQEKDDFKTKSIKNAKLKTAIDEAEDYLNKVKNSGKNSSKTNDKDEKLLLSLDEELKLINGAIGIKSNVSAEEPEIDTKNGKISSQSSPNDSKEKSPAQINESINKKNQRFSALKASNNIKESSTPTQLKQQRKKVSELSGEDLINYCSSVHKTVKTKKRNRSLSQDESNSKSLLTSLPESPTNSKKKRLERRILSDEEDELNFKLDKIDKTSNIEENLRSELSSPIDLSFEIESVTKFEFSSMTILIDSSQSQHKNFIIKLIDEFNKIINNLENDKIIKIVCYDIFEDVENEHNDVRQAVNLKLNELKETNDKKDIFVEFLDDFDNLMLKNEIVFSFINNYKNSDNKKLQKFENILFSSEIDGVKFVSFCPIDYENVMIYHHHFRDNRAIFIEAPFIDFDNYSKIYIFCFDKNFLKTIKYFFEDFFGSKNVILIDEQVGFPSACVTSIRAFLPILKLNKILGDKLSSSISESLKVKCLPHDKQLIEFEKIRNNVHNEIEMETFHLFKVLNKQDGFIENKEELKIQLNKMIEEL